MLFDFFTYLTTKCSPHIRGMGYITEALSMRKRHVRRRAAWQPHLERSREFVLAAAEKCSSRNKAVILGAGLLLDVPLAEIASTFREVFLADVVCLPRIRSRIRAHPNVTFIERDVTNIAENLYRNSKYGIHELPEVALPPPDTHESADLVVSLNIFSQLTVIPRMYAIRHLPGVSEDQLDDWCRRILDCHFSFLRSQAGTVCLISDYEFVKRDQQGAIFSRGSTVFGIKLPKPDLTWTWNIAPLGEESRFHTKELNVGAWTLR